MATERQIAANRRNAVLSTGPRSAAGKQRASQNALKHGLASPLKAVDLAEAVELAKAVAAIGGDGGQYVQYIDKCEAIVDLRRVRLVQGKTWEARRTLTTQEFLKATVALDRYERQAVSRRSATKPELRPVPKTPS